MHYSLSATHGNPGLGHPSCPKLWGHLAEVGVKEEAWGVGTNGLSHVGRQSSHPLVPIENGAKIHQGQFALTGLN